MNKEFTYPYLFLSILLIIELTILGSILISILGIILIIFLNRGEKNEDKQDNNNFISA